MFDTQTNDLYSEKENWDEKTALGWSVDCRTIEWHRMAGGQKS